MAGLEEAVALGMEVEQVLERFVGGGGLAGTSGAGDDLVVEARDWGGQAVEVFDGEMVGEGSVSDVGG